MYLKFARVLTMFAQTISGRPPPAASMAVGQFFNPEEGKLEISPWSMLQSTYSEKVVIS